jgi:hypothetical protein
MQVIYRPEKEQPPRQGKWVCNFIVFQPGANEVSPAALATLLKNPTFAQYVERGAITLPVEAALDQPEPVVVEVIDATKSDAQLSDLSALTIAESEPLIARETDIDRLMTWRDADDRKGIKELISDRLADLAPTGFS